MVAVLSGAAKWYTLPGDLTDLFGTAYEVVGSWPVMVLGAGGILYGLWPRQKSVPRGKPLPAVPPLVVDFMPNGLAILPGDSEWMYYYDACKLALPYWIGELPAEPRKAGEILVAEYARDYPKGFQTRGEAFIHRKSLIAWLQRRQSRHG